MNKQEIVRDIRNIRSYFNSMEVKRRFGIKTVAFDVDMENKKLIFHKSYRESGIHIPDSIKHSIQNLVNEEKFILTFTL